METLLKSLARLNAAKQVEDHAAAKDLCALADWDATAVRIKVLRVAFDILIEEAPVVQ